MPDTPDRYEANDSALIRHASLTRPTATTALYNHKYMELLRRIQPPINIISIICVWIKIYYKSWYKPYGDRNTSARFNEFTSCARVSFCTALPWEHQEILENARRLQANKDLSKSYISVLLTDVYVAMGTSARVSQPCPHVHLSM